MVIFKKIHNWSGLFYQAYRLYGRGILAITILGFVGGIAGGIGIGAIIPLFSLLVPGQLSVTSDKLTTLIRIIFRIFHIPYNAYFLLFLIILLFVAKALVTFIANYINAKIGATYEKRVRLNLFSSIMYCSWPYLMRQKAGYLERTLIDDVSNGVNILFYLSGAILMATSLVMYAVVAINISVKITLITLGLGLASLFLLKKVFFRARKIGEILIVMNKEAAHFINESIIGAKTLKAAAIEKEVIGRGKEIFNELKHNRVSKAIYSGISGAFVEPVGIIFISILFFISYKSPLFNLAEFAAIIYLIQKIFSFTSSVQVKLHNVNEIIPSLQILVAAEKETIQHKETNTGKGEFYFQRNIEFKNIGFSYDSQEVLKNMNLEIKKNEFVGIIGPSGVGKTTIVDLLLRLLRPNSGEILVDGKNINDVKLAEWRKNIGYVSQDIFLNNDTIGNNISYYNNSVTNDEVIKASRIANVYDFVMGLEKGFDTPVGERGTQLSAGQKQRIVMARILVNNPALLILDEATSALDNESELLIRRAVENLRHKITVVMISHRLPSLDYCDKIVVLGEGVIKEQGSPEELKQNKNSYYYKMANITN